MTFPFPTSRQASIAAAVAGVLLEDVIEGLFAGSMTVLGACFFLTGIILAYTGYNLVYALLASPAGWLSDRLGKIKTIVQMVALSSRPCTKATVWPSGDQVGVAMATTSSKDSSRARRAAVRSQI